MLRICLALILILSISSSFALKCWTCTSLSDFCGDPFRGNSSHDFDLSAVKECEKPAYSSLRSFNEPVCLKTTIFYQATNRTVIYRMCDWDSDKSSCHKKKGNIDAVIKFCGTCLTDSCNHGSKVQVYSFMILFLVSLNILSRK